MGEASTDGSAPLVAAIDRLAELREPDGLAFVVANAEHPDCEVRLAVASALPWFDDGDWLEPADLVVSTLIALTSDEDSRVRDWATFGLGSQVRTDGAQVRRCLIARLDDPDGDISAEAMFGLARRHASAVVPRVREALMADAVGRMAVASAAHLRDPSLAGPLAALSTWWDVDDDLLAEAIRGCDPTMVDVTARLVSTLLDAADRSGLRLAVSSELLPCDLGEPDVSIIGSEATSFYALDALMRRAEGSVETAVELIQQDLANAPG